MAQMYASDPYSLVIRVYLLCTLVAITFMYTSAIAVYMAKLYWRLKVNGKWTWRPAVIGGEGADEVVVIKPFEEEEE